MSSTIDSIIEQLRAAGVKANKEYQAAQTVAKQRMGEVRSINRALRAMGVKKVKSAPPVEIPKAMAAQMSPEKKAKLRKLMKDRHANARKHGMKYFDYLKAVREGTIKTKTGKA